MYQNFILLRLTNVPLYACITFYLTTHMFTNSFHLLAILNNDARSIDVLLVIAFNLRGICLEVELTLLKLFMEW